MRGTVLYGPRDIRFEERTAPTIMKPTDAIIRITATYVCGSHLWPYRGINRVAEPTFLHCLTGGARRLDHIWRGFASSIRTWQYRSANSTRLRPTSRPRRQSAGGVASKRHANRCAALINKGETDQALSDCNKAILLDPKNAPTRHIALSGAAPARD